MVQSISQTNQQHVVPAMVLPRQVDFFMRTWMYAVTAILTGGACIFFALADLVGMAAVGFNGPFGLAHVLMLSVPLVLFAFTLLPVYKIRKRRFPLIAIRREGLEVNLIGKSTLPEIVFIPAFRSAWLFATREGFKKETLYIPWDYLFEIGITPSPFDPKIRIRGVTHQHLLAANSGIEPLIRECWFREREFLLPIEEIVATAHFFIRQPPARQLLPPWSYPTRRVSTTKPEGHRSAPEAPPVVRRVGS